MELHEGTYTRVFHLMFVPLHQRLPMDCMIVALQAKSRLFGIVPNVAVLRFDHTAAGGGWYGHAICVFQDEAGCYWCYEADGSMKLHGVKRWAPVDLAKAWGRANYMKGGTAFKCVEFISERDEHPDRKPKRRKKKKNRRKPRKKKR
jgi:hypothetical protein